MAGWPWCHAVAPLTARLIGEEARPPQRSRPARCPSRARAAGGTPANGNAGITDLLVSPEVVADLREIAYNPINSRAVDGTAVAVEAGAVGVSAPDSVRAGMYTSAGIPEFYGINVMELHELGPSKKFTKIFGALSPSSDNNPTTALSNTFAGTDDLVLGVDRTKDSLIRAVAVDAESGSEFNLIADDQYSIRQNKIGYFGSIDEGRVVLDNRVLVGKIIDRS